MAAFLQTAPQFGVVVNFAVKYNPNRALLVGDGLVARFQINDAQTTVCKADFPLDVITGVIRAAMADDVCHLTQCLGRHALLTPLSTNTTHCLRALLCTF